jgi:D-glycero-D-manno-heptose 1,7-bisphosphate phosphatase
MNKAVFLDRDGVINLEVGDYIQRFEDFKLLPHAVKYIAALSQKGIKVFVITNQGGIAKQLYTVAELEKMHQYMFEEVERAGGHITEAYFCPHHPDYGLCLCRKPGSIMVEKALAKYDIDAASSIFIGDKERDIVCAEAAGVKGFLIEENEDWGRFISPFLS